MVETEQSLQTMSRQVRLEQWSGKTAACPGSGMTVRARCRENGIPEKRNGCLSPAATRSFGLGLTDWPLWSNGNLHGIPLRTACFFSAAENATGSRRCTGRATAFFSFTSVWSPAASNGPGRKAKPERPR